MTVPVSRAFGVKNGKAGLKMSTANTCGKVAAMNSRWRTSKRQALRTTGTTSSSGLLSLCSAPATLAAASGDWNILLSTH